MITAARKKVRGPCLFLFCIMAVFAGALFWPIPAVSLPSDYSDTISDASSAAQEAIEKTGASSISLALIEGDRLVWAGQFGLADKTARAPATKETMYAIGSTSKMIATIAVMKLVDQGRIVLDEPVVTYLRSFRMGSPEYKKITVRMLLNHSSGFPGTDWRNGFTTSPLKHSYSLQVLDTLAYQRLKHPPGYLSVYCNDGFTVVEQLIPAVTGKSYARFVQDEILTPLQMHNSRYALESIPEGSFARRYDKDGGELPFLFINVLASGGLYSTPADMARLAGMFIGKGKLGSVRILSENSVAQMAADQTLASFNPVKSDMVSYGLGWDTVRQPGLRAVGVTAWQKGGAIPYTKSMLTVAPDEKIAVFVVGASGNFGSDHAIVLAERILLNALKEKGKIESVPVKLTGKPLPAKAVPAVQLKFLSGYYANSDTLMRVHRGPGNTLNISRYDAETNKWNAWQTGLKMRTGDRFSRTEEPLQSFTFVTGDGRQYLVSRSPAGYGHYQDNQVVAQKVSAPKPLPTAWKKRLNREWLLSNDHPGSDAWLSPSTGLLSIANILLYGGVQVVDPFLSASRAGMMLVIPQLKGRDLNDVVIEGRRGEEWLRLGSFLLRPRDRVGKLSAGKNGIAVAGDGIAEWRFIDISDGPKRLGIAPDLPDGLWRVYDGSLKHIEAGKGKKDINLPGGTYYLLFHDNASVTY
jgi:CubicO group peptidase (beta-lactamase class C family)